MNKEVLVQSLDFKNTDLQAFLATKDDIDYMRSEEDRNHLFVGQWTHQFHLNTLENPDIVQIIVKKGGLRVGYFNLVGLGNPNKSLELGRITVSEPSRGYGSAIIRAVQKLAFTTMGFHRLWLDVIDYNERAFRLYKYLGFVHEGTLREADYFQGKYNSSHLLSMLEHEYFNISQL